MEDRLIGIDELSSYMGIPKNTLYDWRKSKRGPAGYVLGKHLRWCGLPRRVGPLPS